MSRFPEPDDFSHAAIERDVLARWNEEDTFRKSIEAREGASPFVFYEGPPTANGKPGIHHVMARTIKDLFCRYQTMKGHRVDRKGGWDTHGLPVEIEVEKELGLEGRHAVEEYGIAAFNEKCRESVLRYKDLWDELTVRMGYWVDLDDPYITFENEYIESVWNLLKRIHEKGLLYRGHKIQWYSPANGTVLSSHEVSLGYKEIQDVSIVTRARLVGEDRTSLLAWTTTPWTIPSNAAMAVGKDISYVRVRQGDGDDEEFFILAEGRLDETLKGDYDVVQRMTGADLLGLRYQPMWPTFAEELGETAAWRVVLADYVTMEEGTGIVHTAPAFGADDFATSQREDLPLLNPIESDGTFRTDFGEIGGMWFKDADRPIIRDLVARGLLYREDSYVHNYPHDWRKGTPLMQYPVDSWFVKTTALKDRLVALNKTINWQPEGMGTGRFGEWLENNVDWAISRMRYWATPLPVWIEDFDGSAPAGGEPAIEVIGSIAELREKVGGHFLEEALHPRTGEIDLHRPYVDAVTWEGPNGGTMRRVEDLVDAWFDSGSMPYAQWHYPFENQETFRANVPADFIAEAVDQTRGWFYTLHAIATLVDDRVAYRNVVVNGLVLDADGQKMSKSRGNTVDPFVALEQHGADPVRWTMMAASPPWENLRYADGPVRETRRKFFGTLLNTYRFFATYANLDDFAYDEATTIPVQERSELDRWVLSRLQGTIAEVDTAFSEYHPTRAARAIEAFVDGLSNWYVRRSRRRFWKSESGSDKKAAYETLFESLQTVARLMAPIAPFFADWLHNQLGEEGSVHLSDFPIPHTDQFDEDLEVRMALARAVVSAALALRNEAGVNVRQPLGALSVVTGVGGVNEAVLRSVEEIILEEVNVKSLEAISAESGLIQKSAKPNFKLLGKRLGPRMKAANVAIRNLSTEQITRFERDERIELDLDGKTEVLEGEEIEITSDGVEGRLVTQERAGETSVTVALETAVTPALRDEGIARELVNRVQNLRKQAGFHVADRIAIFYNAPSPIEDALLKHSSTIENETLALALTRSPDPKGEAVATVDLYGEDITLAIERRSD